MSLMLINQANSVKDGVWERAEIDISVSRIQYWLVFVTISVLLHIVIIKWVSIPQRLSGDDSDNTIDSRIFKLTMNSPEFESNPATKTKNSTSYKNKKVNKVIQKKDRTKPLKNRRSETTAEIKRKNAVSSKSETKKRTQVLIESAYKEIPGIARELEEQTLPRESKNIFDSQFRKKLYDAYQKKQQTRNLEKNKNTEEYIEVTGVYENSIGVRLDGQCWRIPVSNRLDALDTRIWMADPACTKRKKPIDFSVHSLC